MPELPEVETVRRQLEASINKNDPIDQVVLHRPDLRWTIPAELPERCQHQSVQQVDRRGKYLLFRLSNSEWSLLSHLGMSGQWRWLNSDAYRTHDHVEIRFRSGRTLVYNDPRRFGVLDLSRGYEHRLLSSLGVEPLTESWSGGYLHEITRGKTAAIKQLLMNAKLVVGIGNIYAVEALFRARISPQRRAQTLKRSECDLLVQAVNDVLQEAIESGGSTIRSYLSSHDQAGEFQNRLFVYDREGQPCRTCSHKIRRRVDQGRSTYWCPRCQGPERRNSLPREAKYSATRAGS